MAELLDGERVAARMKMELADRVARLQAMGRTVGLGTILVGDDGPSAKYVAMKHADCEEIGIRSHHAHLPATATHDDVAAVVDQMNAGSQSPYSYSYSQNVNQPLSASDAAALDTYGQSLWYPQVTT